jgi:hypothetical protein
MRSEGKEVEDKEQVEGGKNMYSFTRTRRTLVSRQ